MAVKNPARRVVLTRPADRQQALANHLRQSGCEVLELPALTISPIYPEEQPLQPRQSLQSEPSGSSEQLEQLEQFDRPVHQSKQGLQRLEKNPEQKPEQKIEQQIQQQIQQRSQQTLDHQSSSDAEVTNWQPSKFHVLVFVSRAAWQNYHRFYLDRSEIDLLRSARFGFNERSSRSAGSSGVGGADPSGRDQFGSTSQPEVRFGVQAEGSTATEAASFQTPVLACVGVSTARQIADDLDLPLAAITYPKGDLPADSEGLWTLLKPQLPPNAKILIVRGQSGRDWLTDTLTQHGATVTCLSVYRREPATWSKEHLATLKSWANDENDAKGASGEVGEIGASDASAGSNASDASDASDVAQADQCSSGTWLITSAEGLAAIEKQYEFHGLTGKLGFAPQRVVVVHERLKAPVCRWLAHWQTPQVNMAAATTAASGDTNTSLGHTGADLGAQPGSELGIKLGAEIPVVVVAPDDGAIAEGILRVGE